MMISSDKLKATVSSLPDSPGVYRYYNEEGILIYVGKAKSLKKRVSSYFNKQSQYNRKTEKLVSEIAKIEFTLANTEFDALLMENNFIKQKKKNQKSNFIKQKLRGKASGKKYNCNGVEQ